MSVLLIDEHKPLSYFQKEFSTLFPFLKIDFFKASLKQEDNKNQKAQTLLPSNYMLSKNSISINVDASTTVEQLKSTILEKVGLFCLVYRKSGTMWIETSLTEDWSLERQNHEAELMNIH